MSRFAVAVALFILLHVVGLGVALADYPNPHTGSYSIQTSSCASCHRAHTGSSVGLLVSPANTICLSCHDGTGTMLDVVDGSYGIGNIGNFSYRLNGGGFSYIGGVAVTSKHNTGEPGTAWGGASAGPGVSFTLECTSCHDPHGTTNYRLLKDTGSAPLDDPELLAWQDYQVLPAEFPLLGGGATLYSTRNQANYTQGMNRFCASCHKGYYTRSGSADTPSTSAATNGDGNPIYQYPGTEDALDGHGDVARYRHSVSVAYTLTPAIAVRRSILGDDPTNGDDPENPTGAGLLRQGVVCTTCHFAHGTTATATGYAANVPPTNDSALLYYPNRGVCMACHNR